MFNVYNLALDTVSFPNQIKEFEAEHQHRSSWTISFFSEYSNYTSAQDILNIQSIDLYVQDIYLKFLKKHETKIKKIIIHIDIYGDFLPYEFLKNCLSTLGHVKCLKIICNSSGFVFNDFFIDDLFINKFYTFSKLGDALNALASFEDLRSLDLDVNHLSNFEKSTVQDTQDFINFLSSCRHLEKFYLKTTLFDDFLKIRIIDRLITLPELTEIEINLTNTHSFLSSYEFFNLGKFFQSKSLTKLTLAIGGVFMIDTSQSRYPSAHEQMRQFASQLKICSPLQSLELNFKTLRFANFEFQNPLDLTTFDIDALTPIGYNKSLEHLSIQFPFNAYSYADLSRWVTFIRRFKNSRMINLESPNLYWTLRSWDRLILLHEVKLMTEANQALNVHIQPLRQLLTMPNVLTNDFNVLAREVVALKNIQELDKRLYQVDLRNAHWKNQHSQLSASFSDFRLYLYFCTLLCDGFNNPFNPDMSSVARIPSSFIMMSILSYLDQKDLSQMFQLSRGILKTIQEEIQYYSSFKSQKHSFAYKDFIFYLGQKPKVENTPIQIQTVPQIAEVRPLFSLGLINEVVLNDLSIKNHNGFTIAMLLSISPEGCKLLAANDYQLAKLIHDTTLNAIISNDRHADISLAYCLASSPEGQQILVANDGLLAKSINETSLNAVISHGPNTGLSVALCLASSPEGVSILTANNFRLAKLINETCLNTVISQGKKAGFSVAYWLAFFPEGRQILSENNYQLAKLINKTSLNTVIRDGRHAGFSVAYWLAFFPEGRQILRANNYQLTELIDKTSLNTVIRDGRHVDLSVAYCLAFLPEGCQILAANNYQLAKLINETSLNALGQNAGLSVAYWLASLPEGVSILAANDYQLAKLIQETSLNTVINHGPNAGLSIAHCLASSPEGRLILENDNCRLAKLITIDILRDRNAQMWLSQILKDNSALQLGTPVNSLFNNKKLKRKASEMQNNDDNNVEVKKMRP